MIRAFFIFSLAIVSLFSEPIKPADAFKIKVSEVENLGINFDFDIYNNVYLYEREFKIFLLPNRTELNSMLNLPKAFTYKDHQIYRGNFDILVPFGLIFNSTKLDNFDIGVEFTGCSNDGFCYQPQVLTYNFKQTDKNYTITKLVNKKSVQATPSTINTASEHGKIATSLKSDNFFITIITFLGYGALLALTPCVFPMIPILSSIIVARKSDDKTTKSGFFISFVYVFAMSLAYALAGIGASFFGVSLQGVLQKPALIIAFSLIFVILALSMFGLFEIKISDKIQTFLSKKTDNKKGMGGVFIMGFLSALIVGPCVAAPLAGALLYIAQTGDALLGGIALFVMGFGMGIPLLLIGAGSSKLLPKPGIWMQEVQNIFGFLLLFMAIWMTGRILDENLLLLLYGALGIIFAFFLGVFDGAIYKIRRGVAFFILVYSVLLIIGFASGANDILKPLQNLLTSSSNTQISAKKTLTFNKVSTIDQLENFIKNAKKPVMVDFWASWCISCKELDNITFKDSRVIDELAKFELVKVDVTKNTQDDAALLSKFGVFGPPALIFYKDGKELKDNQMVGFVKPDDFLGKISPIN